MQEILGISIAERKEHFAISQAAAKNKVMLEEVEIRKRKQRFCSNY
jgi:hypothetical protein